MSERPPRRKFAARDYVAFLATMLFGFGILTFLLGSAAPWGTRQLLGLTAAGLGIGLMVLRLWLPRPPG